MGKPDNLIVSRIKLGVALEGLKLDKRKETRCPNHKGISLSAQASLSLKYNDKNKSRCEKYFWLDSVAKRKFFLVQKNQKKYTGS